MEKLETGLIIRPGFGFWEHTGIKAFRRAESAIPVELGPVARGIRYGRRIDTGTAVSVDERGIEEQR